MVKEQHGIKYLATRQFNQDPLENHFGIIRQHGGCNTMPTVGQFSAAMKSALVNLLSTAKSRNGNCADDQRDILLDLEVFFNRGSSGSRTADQEMEVREEEVSSMADTLRTSKTRPSDSDAIDWDLFVAERAQELEEECNESEDANFPDITDRLSTAYVGGYLKKRLLPKH